MAVSRLTTVSERHWSTAQTDASLTHTVDTGTTLLVYSINVPENTAVTAAPSWSGGGGEALTLVEDTNTSAGTRVYTYALVSPTAAVGGTISCTVESKNNGGVTAVNYDGTVTTSVAAAISTLEEVQNTSNSNTTVFASAGTSGNGLYAFAGFYGGDGDAATASGSFSVVVAENTGGSTTADTSFTVIDLVNGAPSALTITWQSSDQNGGHYLEIVAAGGSNTDIPVPLGPVW